MKFGKKLADGSLQTLIARRIANILSPLEWFVRQQAAASSLLLLSTLLALALANSPWSNFIPAVADAKITLSVHYWSFNFSTLSFINDILLSLFFLLLGLEIKREILTGHLNDPRKVALIVFAALGGMVMPALIYYAFNSDGAAQVGWAIPTATDTALAIGVLALLARYVSISVSIFLAALAIFDDIGAILIIAAFYTESLDIHALLVASIIYGLLGGVNLIGIRGSWLYIVLGVVFWWFIHESGLHATLAGLLMALTIPARSRISQRSFITRIRQQILVFEKNRGIDGSILKSPDQHQQMAGIGETVRAASTPLQRWHATLGNPIAIIVLPLFALFNAGVQLSADTVSHVITSSVTQGVIIGLVIGKPVGVALFGLSAIKMRFGALPEGMTMHELIGVGLLAGIGFTMSLFISMLSFEGQQLLYDEAKVGILIASAIAAPLGGMWFYLFRGRNNIAPHISM